jgi:hypothetical protein
MAIVLLIVVFYLGHRHKHMHHHKIHLRLLEISSIIYGALVILSSILSYPGILYVAQNFLMMAVSLLFISHVFMELHKAFDKIHYHGHVILFIANHSIFSSI